MIAIFYFFKLKAKIKKVFRCMFCYTFFVLITNRVMPNSIYTSIKPKLIPIAINAWFSKVIIAGPFFIFSFILSRIGELFFF